MSGRHHWKTLDDIVEWLGFECDLDAYIRECLDQGPFIWDRVADEVDRLKKKFGRKTSS